MDQTTVDNVTTKRFIHYLITPYDQWEAFRIGIIDRDGKVKREPKNNSETIYFNMFHMLVIRLKDLLKTSGKGTNWVLPSSAGQFYLGNKNLAPHNFTNWTIANRASLPIFGAAYSSMRECVSLGDISLFESFMHFYLDRPEKIKEIIEDIAVAMVPGTSTANVSMPEKPLSGTWSGYKAKNKKKVKALNVPI